MFGFIAPCSTSWASAPLLLRPPRSSLVSEVQNVKGKHCMWRQLQRHTLTHPRALFAIVSLVCGQKARQSCELKVQLPYILFPHFRYLFSALDSSGGILHDLFWEDKSTSQHLEAPNPGEYLSLCLQPPAKYFGFSLLDEMK